MSNGEAIEQAIDDIIRTLGGKEKYITVIIGVLVGSEKDVKTTEEEFDDNTGDLLCTNAFIKLTGFRKKEGGWGIRYIVHIQSKYNQQEYNCSDPFDSIHDAHIWGVDQCREKADMYWRIEKVEY